MSNETKQGDDFNVVLPTISKKETPFGGKSKDKENKTPNEVWINVGKYMDNPFYNPEDPNSQKQLFIGYTLGIPADGAEAPTIPGDDTKNKEYQLIAQVRYAMFKQIEKAMQEMQPGGSRKLNLDVEMRRIKAKANPDSIDMSKNPLLAQFLANPL